MIHETKIFIPSLVNFQFELRFLIFLSTNLKATFKTIIMSVAVEGFENAQDVSGDKNYLQHIPAKINYEGPANVKSFFTNFTSQNEKESNTPLFNAFRGRPLNGKI